MNPLVRLRSNHAAEAMAGIGAMHGPRGSFAGLAVGALGIVYGDIGTSPLYAMDQLFFGRADGAQTPADVLGGVSLVIWAITVIVAVKYASLVLRARTTARAASSRFTDYCMSAASAARSFCCGAHAGRRLVVRRRDHHPVHQRIVGSRGPARHDAGFGRRRHTGDAWLRFRLFLFLRLISQPAYYYYGLGDEVLLSVEIIPVRVHEPAAGRRCVALAAFGISPPLDWS
jgi:hypothetical protein